jgi:phosphoribosylamine--glycine ligase
MRILLIGSGGREHALAWKMSRSGMVDKVFVHPGSDGISTLEKVECVPSLSSIVSARAVIHENGASAGSRLCGNDEIAGIAHALKPALIVIGPEKPMAEGAVDKLEAAGFAVLGPSQAAAQLETSKIYSKRFMSENAIPTARAIFCDSYDDAMAIVRNWDMRKGIVIKADGLAAGKGVVVTHDAGEAEATLYDFMKNPACTVKASRILLEDKLVGREVSAFALCDGEKFIPLGYACDYKRVNDGDLGPNTGGMGGYAPKGWPSDKARVFVNEHVFAPVLRGMKKRGTPYKGILFAGLMIDGDDVKVIEFNVRFGDPETQILMPLFEGDIVPLFLAAAKGRLAGEETPKHAAQTAVHVVMVSQGYPDVQGEGMKLGQRIDMPNNTVSGTNDNALLFIAGAKKEGGEWRNAGGRVLGVTALGATLDEARKKAYAEIEKIKFDGAHWRRDIGT